MFALYTLGLTCLMASTAYGEAQFFYPTASHHVYAPRQHVYSPWQSPYANSFYYPQYQSQYYPQYQQPLVYYPSAPYQPQQPQVQVSSAASKPVEVEKKEEKHALRQIIPTFDYLRSGGSGVSYLRPDEVRPQPVQNEKNIVTYTVPYHQAYLNRVPATWA